MVLLGHIVFPVFIIVSTWTWSYNVFNCHVCTYKYLVIQSPQNSFKGIVHLNIIFSYMKVNKICKLDHPVY